MIYLDADPDCDLGGYSIVVAFSSAVPSTSRWTLYRIDDYGTSAVHGAEDLVVGDTAIASIVDYEAPINIPMTYQVVASGFGTQSLAVPALSDTCTVTQYLRDLLDPNVYYTSNFCLGTIDQTESSVRSGKFHAIGRGAPIVVVDTRETETGTLRFVAKDQSQIDELKRIFSRGTPLLLQVDRAYNLGRNGVLYFQPDKFVDRWVNPNAKIPQHVFEVAYTVVDPPSYTTRFFKFGIPLDVPITPTPGYEVPTGPLVGRRYCEGGLAQRYDTFDELTSSDLTFVEAYYLADSCAD